MVVCRHIWYCPSAPPCISYQVVCLKTEPNFSRRFRRQPKESLTMILLLWICLNFKKWIQLPNSLKSIKLLLFVSIKITVKSILTQFLKLSNTCLIKKLQTCTNFKKWIQTHVDTCISLTPEARCMTDWGKNVFDVFDVFRIWLFCFRNFKVARI